MTYVISKKLKYKYQLTYFEPNVRFFIDNKSTGLFAESHRVDGPAIIWNNSRYEFKRNNLYHNLSGPAFCRDSAVSYFINNQEISRKSGKLKKKKKIIIYIKIF